MIAVLKIINWVLKALSSLTILGQIVLAIVILLTAGYWFFSLIGTNFLSFVYPLAEIITKFVHQFYHQQVKIGGQSFDGALLLFDLILAVSIVLLSKLRYYIGLGVHINEKNIRILKDIIEENFNMQLQRETEKRISKLSNIAILVEFEIHTLGVNNLLGERQKEGLREITDEVFRDFQASIRAIPKTKIAKTDNKMLILNSDFNNVEKIFDAMNNSIYDIKQYLRKKRWLLDFYISADIYEKDSDIKDCYPVLQNLIGLKIKGEVVTPGNFAIRYSLLDEQNYEISGKGQYKLRNDEDISVWTIIKKF